MLCSLRSFNCVCVRMCVRVSHVAVYVHVYADRGSGCGTQGLLHAKQVSATDARPPSSLAIRRANSLKIHCKRMGQVGP